MAGKFIVVVVIIVITDSVIVVVDQNLPREKYGLLQSIGTDKKDGLIRTMDIQKRSRRMDKCAWETGQNEKFFTSRHNAITRFPHQAGSEIMNHHQLKKGNVSTRPIVESITG